MGDFENAKSLFEQAETASARAGLSGDHVNWLIDIGVVQFAQHDYGSADATMKRALQLARELHDNESVIQCLNYLSQIALDSGAAETAEKYNGEASALQRMRASISLEYCAQRSSPGESKAANISFTEAVSRVSKV